MPRPGNARILRVAREVARLDPCQKDFMARFNAVKEIAEIGLVEVRRRSIERRDLAYARQRSLETRQRQARELREKIRPIIAALREEGVNSYREIAAALDERGIKPARGEKWAPSSVRLIEHDDGLCEESD